MQKGPPAALKQPEAVARHVKQGGKDPGTKSEM